MITEAATFAALCQHLAAMPDALPLVYPNKVGLPPRPYLVAQQVRGPRSDPTLAATATIGGGQLVVTVVIDLNVFSTLADNLAEAVAARFPAGLRLASGQIEITGPADIATGYADDVSWRVPVRIKYRTS